MHLEIISTKQWLECILKVWKVGVLFSLKKIPILHLSPECTRFIQSEIMLIHILYDLHRVQNSSEAVGAALATWLVLLGYGDLIRILNPQNHLCLWSYLSVLKRFLGSPKLALGYWHWCWCSNHSQTVPPPPILSIFPHLLLIIFNYINIALSENCLTCFILQNHSYCEPIQPIYMCNICNFFSSFYFLWSNVYSSISICLFLLPFSMILLTLPLMDMMGFC